MRHVRFFVVLAVLVASTTIFAVTALAQTPAGQGYGGQSAPVGGVAAGETGGGGVQGAQAGALPFTGVDLALLVAGGLALTAVGAGLVRAGARR